MKQHIPNLITLGNLLCGTLGIIVILVPDNPFNFPPSYAALLLILAAVLDFFDGFSARLLKVSSEIGKQLDSLSDAVTFGVLPGLMTYQWLNAISTIEYLPFIGLIIPLLSVYRLAKFNIDTRQTSSFIGLPTPANALFFASFWLIGYFEPESFIIQYISMQWVVAGLSILFSILLIAELPLFSLKLKSLQWKENKYVYFFLISSIGLFACFCFTAIPFIILLYLLISMVKNILER